MVQIIFHFIANNYLSMTSLLCLLIIAFGDKRLSAKDRYLVLIMDLLIALLCVSDYVDYTIDSIDYSQYWQVRFIAATTCYIIRPIMLFFVVCAIGKFNKRHTILLSLPLILNTFIFASSFLTHLGFFIDSNNTFIRGPFGLLPHIIAIVFMFILMISLWRRDKTLDIPGQLSIICINIAIILSVIIDSVTSTHTLNLTIVLSFIIYYLLMYVRHSNKMLNATEEELDAKRNALLLSQIHPHFIYNTLNVIYYLCRTDGAKAADVVLNFSEYLHTTLELSLENDFIPIEKELELTRNYTYIEKTRFEDLNILFDIQDGGYMIPPLSIQPIVENAIRHGVYGMQNGTVSVSLCLDTTSNEFPHGCHIIVIHDNGCGSLKESSNLGSHKGIGLQNVKTRIKELTSGTLEMIMTAENGTSVIIKIPIKTQIKSHA